MNRQHASLVLAGAATFAGLGLYLAFRPGDLLLIQWTRALGLGSGMDALRAFAGPFRGAVPVWAVYSLPYALWVGAYLIVVRVVWGGSKSALRHVWFWCVPAIAIGAELGQGVAFVRGTFDLRDLLCLNLAIVFATTMSPRSSQSGAA